MAAVHRLEMGVLTLRVGGQAIETTAEHPFFVAGVGWRRARQLTPGDQLLGADGETTTVDAVFPAERTAPVFNLRVEVDHTYFVGTPAWGFSVWVHNAYVARPSADGKWEVFDDIKNEIIKHGMQEQEAKSYAHFGNLPKQPHVLDWKLEGPKARRSSKTQRSAESTRSCLRG